MGGMGVICRECKRSAGTNDACAECVAYRTPIQYTEADVSRPVIHAPKPLESIERWEKDLARVALEYGLDGTQHAAVKSLLARLKPDWHYDKPITPSYVRHAALHDPWVHAVYHVGFQDGKSHR